MSFRKQSLGIIVLLSSSVVSLGISCNALAQDSTLPSPAMTYKLDGSLSEIASMQSYAINTKLTSPATPAIAMPVSKTTSIIKTPLIEVKKVTLVELKSEFVKKSQALKIANKDHYDFNIAYSITAGKKLTPEQLSDKNYFYVNRKTHRIGVAINHNAAKAISVTKDQVYSVRGGDTLKNTLARWASEAGYQIEWLSEYDYPLKYSYEFIGKLSDKIGPLNKILSSISNSSYALKAVITKNNVILIKDNDFSPSILGR